MIRLICFFFSYFLLFPLLAQTRIDVPVNQHFFEISPDSVDQQVYFKTISFSKDSVKIERFFSLDNKMIRVQKTHPNQGAIALFESEDYNTDGDLVKKHSENRNNGHFITTYFDQGQQVAQVIYDEFKMYSIHRQATGEPYKTWYNDFLPLYEKASPEKGKFPGLEFTYNSSNWPATPQLFYFGIYVNESGEVEAIEHANPLEGGPNSISFHHKKVVSWAKNKTFIPAKDPFGNPIGKWLYIHFHAGGKAQIGKIIYK